MTPGRNAVERLLAGQALTREDCVLLLTCEDDETLHALREGAVAVRKQWYQNKVYIRGLIEFTNWCKNNCYYCGIRRDNRHVERYRLAEEQILQCCDTGYALGFRTFVLQGGEDPYFDDDRLCDIIRAIKGRYSDCAVTLSVGERSRESYQKLYDAGADRYLLRHETACDAHYAKLHPPELTLQNRKRCLNDLKEIGFQTGCGFMVGSPFQTVDTFLDDLLFLQDFQPEMVGIGPFLPHHDTPFASQPAGSFSLTLRLLSIVRLMLPKVLLPATTALGTIHPQGRELGIEAGANVVMPNLSPKDVRDKYLLYDNKLATGAEAAESLADLRRRMEAIGYEVVEQRGDYPG